VKVVQKAIALITILGLLAGALSMVVAQEPLIESVCLVTDVGKVNDGTFNQFAYDGMVAAVEDFDLDSTFIETVAPTDYQNNIQTCIDSGYDAIITVGFLLQDATLVAAEANPNVYFIGVDQGYETAPPNLVGVQFREDQSGFLAGALAAQMTQTGTIAGVYGIPVPAVVKFQNGFEQGAKYINPDIDVRSVFIQSFVDPAAGAEAAEQLIAEGADVIFGAGGQTGSGAIQRAAAEGIYVIGVDQDEYFSTFGGGESPGSEYLISSAIKRVDQGVYLSLKALVEGNLEEFGGGGNRVLSAENEGVGFAPAHDAEVPEEVTAMLEEILAGLRDGTIETGVDPVTGELLEMVEPEETPEASG